MSTKPGTTRPPLASTIRVPDASAGARSGPNSTTRPRLTPTSRRSSICWAGSTTRPPFTTRSNRGAIRFLGSLGDPDPGQRIQERLTTKTTGYLFRDTPDQVGFGLVRVVGHVWCDHGGRMRSQSMIGGKGFVLENIKRHATEDSGLERFDGIVEVDKPTPRRVDKQGFAARSR